MIIISINTGKSAGKAIYSVLNREKDDTDKNKPVREKSAANVAVFLEEDIMAS